MFPDEKKLTRLTSVLKMYYEQDMSQKDIADAIGVSRPMVSKLLAEAKSLNMVTITINEVKNMQQIMSHRIAEEFNLHEVVVIPTERKSPAQVERLIANECYQMCLRGKVQNPKVGIGCGSVLGQVSELTKARNKCLVPIKEKFFR